IARVSELVKQQIGEVLQELGLTDCGLITVTSAAVAPDLKDGRIYVSVIGSDEQKKRAISLLELRHGHIQHELAKRIVLKYTPRLKFILDETESHAQRIETLLAKLNPSEPQ
ncbi:MAG: 30S ribosome-binding factor RbfA, partial [Verrucomicrobiota bacterium]